MWCLGMDDLETSDPVIEVIDNDEYHVGPLRQEG